MWKRYQSWADANPLLDWLSSVILGLAFVGTGFLVIPGPKTPGLVMLLLCCIMSPPTYGLVQRFSDGRRQARPAPPFQEKAIGVFALSALLASVAAFSLVIAGKRMGWPTDAIGYLIAFSLSALLSLHLAYAVRHTPTGRLSLRLTLGWLALLVLAAAVETAWRSLVHS